MSERNYNENAHKPGKRQAARALWIKIMAWVLSLLMAGSVATLTIAMLLEH